MFLRGVEKTKHSFIYLFGSIGKPEKDTPGLVELSGQLACSLTLSEHVV
jgi:hypothetical protein